MLKRTPLESPALRASPYAYTRSQIALHWLVAALVLLQYATSGAIVRTHSIHLIGQRPSPTDLVLHTLHNRVGLSIVALMLGRLVLRLWFGAPSPEGARRSIAARIVQGVHFAFYAVLVAEGVTGAVASYFWWPISAAHVVLFKVLLALVAIHVAAALWHEFVRKDAVMRRVGIKSLFGRRAARTVTGRGGR
jgi:cytochrome b561